MRKNPGPHRWLNLSPVIGFVFSWNGFTAEAETYLKEQGIAYSDDDQWLESPLR
ncbi:MAG: hypothetical protein ACM3SY_17105 [Candidatus Omnitrophota bacterium]